MIVYNRISCSSHEFFKFSQIILFFFFLCFCIIALIDSSSVTSDFLNTAVLPNLILSVLSLLFCIADIKRRFLLFIFSAAFAIQINGKYFTHIFDDNLWGNFYFSVASSISYENEFWGLSYIFLAQMAVLFAYQSQFTVSFPFKLDFGDVEEKRYIGNWSKRVMWFAFVFAFVKVLLKVMFVFQYGYLASYLTNGVVLYNNPVIDILEKFYWLGFIGFLGTFPEKKDLKTPIAVFLIYSVLTLFEGSRGGLVINILFVLWYLMKRDLLFADDRQIITSRVLKVMTYVGVVSLYLLYIYGHWRMGLDISFDDFFGKIFLLVETHGISGRLPALCLEYSTEIESILPAFMFVFWPIHNFLLNNSIVRIFTGGIFGQGFDSISKAPDFGGVITYITNTQAYLDGGGLGTSFIAEWGTAYGWIGVVLFSFMLGVLLRKIDKMDLMWGWPETVLALNAVPILGYIPRQTSLGIIPGSAALVLYVILMQLFFRWSQVGRRM